MFWQKFISRLGYFYHTFTSFDQTLPQFTMVCRGCFLTVEILNEYLFLFMFIFGLDGLTLLKNWFCSE